MEYQLLLVEDEKWVRTGLRKTIEKLELPVRVAHEASNGMDASDWLRSNQAELVLTDILMPVMDGLTLLQDIKDNGISADVVMISGYDDFMYAQQALRRGAFDYLLKPVEKEDLESCLRSWMNSRERIAEKKTTSSEVNLEELSPIDQVIHYIKTNRAYNMSSAEAADWIHLNASYFSKIFKQSKGITFTDYVTSMKMEEATELLKKTSLRVNEISDRLGFTDPAYFTNTFKKSLGLTPSEFRKSL